MGEDELPPGDGAGDMLELGWLRLGAEYAGDCLGGERKKVGGERRTSAGGYADG